jgi:hypothetical protein
MAEKSFAGRARLHASYDAEPWAFARATWSGGILITL